MTSLPPATSTSLTPLLARHFHPRYYDVITPVAKTSTISLLNQLQWRLYDLYNGTNTFISRCVTPEIDLYPDDGPL